MSHDHCRSTNRSSLNTSSHIRHFELHSVTCALCAALIAAHYTRVQLIHTYSRMYAEHSREVRQTELRNGFRSPPHTYGHLALPSDIAAPRMHKRARAAALGSLTQVVLLLVLLFASITRYSTRLDLAACRFALPTTYSYSSSAEQLWQSAASSAVRVHS